jgi:hypothetical protein
MNRLGYVTWSDAKQAGREDSRTKETQKDGSGYEVIGHFFTTESSQALAIRVETFLQFPGRNKKMNKNLDAHVKLTLKTYAGK